ncbi:MAG: pyruvate ferredoxin oxidoreductase [Gammaproteobacteria bacterium SG8_47]|nr:MAG: pyruvate ferredoxin oxidoreductase [Gammaproteobacteria bacterium SG8_47]
MRTALEGSQAIAQAVALCRPQVIAAYPITPQTHIVENIAKLVADGSLECELISVESEFSAASVALGAVAAGSRAYTASASQGILLMSEVLYNIAGLRIPLVMTCANRAISAPLSIWNDQQDSMAVRDAGWIQLYCADNQEAVDTTIQAFRIAEATELPVMVCVDGFTLTHTLEPIEIPTQQQVDSFLPAFTFSRSLDPHNPISVGTLVSPDYYPEARHSHHQALLRAESEIVGADSDWASLTGRGHGGLLSIEGPADARIGILTLGSVIGTLADAREVYPELPPVKLIRLRAYRPLPMQAIQAACAGLDELIVLERALSLGSGGIVGPEVRAALCEIDRPPRIHNFAIGLGGRDIPLDIYPRLVQATRAPEHARFEVFDVELQKLPEEDR